VTPPRFDDEGAFEAARKALLAAMPPAHLAFLKTMPLSAQIGGYFFAHAGIRPGTALDAQEPEDLMWIREAFLSSRSDFGAVVVHGHTPMAEAQRAVNRISVDTGAYATGRLSAVVLETDTCRFLHT
jgi:serine/threonine protein phosphatase 1